jgi:hypothetical protein
MTALSFPHPPPPPTYDYVWFASWFSRNRGGTRLASDEEAAIVLLKYKYGGAASSVPIEVLQRHWPYRSPLSVRRHMTGQCKCDASCYHQVMANVIFVPPSLSAPIQFTWSTGKEGKDDDTEIEGAPQ